MAQATHQATFKGQAFEWVGDEDIRVGDVIDTISGWGQVVAIRPYGGPLTDIVLAVVETVPGGKCSLEIGGFTRRVSQ